MHSGVGACDVRHPFSGQAPCLGATPTGPQHTSFCTAALDRNCRVFWLFAALFGCRLGGLPSLILCHATGLLSCRTGSRARHPGCCDRGHAPSFMGLARLGGRRSGCRGVQHRPRRSPERRGVRRTPPRGCSSRPTPCESTAGPVRSGGPSRLGGPTLAGPAQPSTAWRSKSRIPRSSSSPQGSLGASRTPAWCCGAGLTSPPLRCRGWAE